MFWKKKKPEFKPLNIKVYYSKWAWTEDNIYVETYMGRGVGTLLQFIVKNNKTYGVILGEDNRILEFTLEKFSVIKDNDAIEVERLDQK